jgi:hypothetical protein
MKQNNSGINKKLHERGINPRRVKEIPDDE